MQKFNVMDTHHLDEARHIVGKYFCSHKLEITNSGKAFHATHNIAAGNLISLNYLSYGETVLIEPGELESFYLLQIPLQGHADITNGGVSFETSQKCAAILNPDRHTRMVWHAKCEQILVYIPRESLRKIAATCIGQMPSQEVVFEPDVHFENDELASLRSNAILLAKAADAGEVFGDSGSLNQILFEETFITNLLLHQPSNISNFFRMSSKGIASRSVKAARDFIIENSVKPISLSEIAAAARLPIRTLQHQFKHMYGMSPTELLRTERLCQIHHELKSGNCEDDLAIVASRYGMSHAGRFSKLYKTTFGELPSQTKQAALRSKYLS